MSRTAETLKQELAAMGRSSYPILDMHAHMGNHGGGFMSANTPEKQLYFMDRANVKCATFVGHRGLFIGPEGVYEDLAIAKRYPGRFKLYYPVIAPMLEDYPGLQMVEENNEFIGLKFLCDYHGAPLSDPRHTPFWEYADARRLPVLVHTGGKSPLDGPEEAEKILGRYHNLSFIAGHSFMGDPAAAARLAGAYENIYLELTAVLTWRGPLEVFAEAGLLQKVLFGVDAPWFSYEYYIGALLSAEITDEQRKDIFWRNALGVYQKAGINIESDWRINV